MQCQCNVQEDRSELVYYNNPEFPVYVRRGILSTYPNFSAISHWHDDVELILVESGHMQYNVNGTTVMLHEGEGIFVNTRQLHYGFSKDFGECVFFCILIHPMLLCASPYVEKTYIKPVLENETVPYLLLHPDREHEKDVLNLIRDIYQSREEETFPVRVQGLFFGIWENLFLLAGRMEKKVESGYQHLSILKDMIRFIYENYTEKVTLASISRAGKVGKTTCCAIFQKYTNETPMSYLAGYRMKKGVELLETTDRTVSEICFEVGFSSASYFAETFRKRYGCTPMEYRRRRM